MQRFVLDEKTLLQVEQPMRYIGGEIGSAKKDPDKVKLRFTMCSPDVYEIGMSHLGMQISYSMFNRREDVYYERVSPLWTNLDRIPCGREIPLFTLEGQCPVREYDFFGIMLQCEMYCIDILQVLELSEIPLHAADRSDSDPIVIGGGPYTYNPKPTTPFSDLSYMGEGEVIHDQLLDFYLAYREAGDARNTFLKKTVALPGIYVSSLYEPYYREDGTSNAFEPLCLKAPASVRHLAMSVPDRADFIDAPLVPFIHAAQDRFVSKLMRGCIRGCRLCQVRNVYCPQREHSVEYLEHYAEKLPRITGNEETSLNSLSFDDHSRLREFLEYLIQYTKERKVNISLLSLRVDAFLLDVIQHI